MYFAALVVSYGEARVEPNERRFNVAWFCVVSKYLTIVHVQINESSLQLTALRHRVK